MTAFEVPLQVVVNGGAKGLAFGVLAVGVILIWRSSKVINFALGELGALGAALFVRFAADWHWNYWAALVVVVAATAVLGAGLELAVVRRLGHAPRVVLFVATIGAAQLFTFLQFTLPDVQSYGPFPRAVDRTWHVAGIDLRGDQLVAVVLVPAVVAALAWFLNRTRHGLAIRAAADNRDAARLAAVPVKATSTAVWALAGGLAALTAILVAPLSDATVAGTTSMGPSVLLRTLAAALVAGLTSLPLALVAGVAIGVAEAVVFYNHASDPGLLDGLLLVVVLVTVLLRGSGARLGSRESWSFSPRTRPVPPQLRELWVVRNLSRLGVVLALLAAVAAPMLADRPSRQYLYARILVFALIALSLTVLTGWGGQLSLGQVAFVGIGAMTTAALVHARLAFPAAVVVAALVAAVAAALVGAPALRVSGLLLAVTTLALAVAAPWLLTRSVFLGDRRSATVLRPVVGGVDLAPQRTYYYVCLAVLLVAMVALARFRASGAGRSLLATRDNERVAAAMGIPVARVKLTSFLLSGGLAGLAGGLFAGLLVQFPAARFTATDSLRVVAIAVIGGLASIGGTVLGALWVIGLPAFFPGRPEAELLASGMGLLVLLLYVPGGLVQVALSARDGLLGLLARRLPPVEAARPPLPARAAGLPSRPPAPPGLAAALRAREVSVRFGQRVVLDGVDVEVRPGEVVGLIGSNGAGKSTLMNALGGLVPSTGQVEVLGTDITGLAAHRRATAGLGRTFQGAELYGDLTVLQTVAVALEQRAPVGPLAAMVGTPRARRLERAKRAHAEEILLFLGLGDWRDRFVTELSTGLRRIVELACLLASEARVLCLDEPTAGIAQRESEAFGPLILRIREELDASLLVIEHDMPLVMSISDRVYCLEAGKVIAAGTPAEVRADPLVVASYLGTVTEAIERSDAVLNTAGTSGREPT